MQVKRLQFLFLSFLLLLKNPSLAQNLNDDGQDVKRSHFPDGFFFGTSTSSYQVEGAYIEDGKGLNNWDVFSHIPGNIKNNDNGDIADNHYYRFLLKQGGSIGIVGSTEYFEPLRNNELDRQAVSRALAFTNAWLFDAVVFGDYPAEMRLYLGSALPAFSPEETSYVKGSLDFIGMNFYTSLYAKDCIHSACISGGDRPIQGFVYTTGERDGFSPPQQNDQVEALLQDTNRVDFHKSYLAALARAIR
ncbi:hypothetical protein POTOM_003089 [Populus tomentosa]|uniref:Uncharacterized protein n=1 Tax=Populus tomentosa TaxID=118781 RepID=A0A8X8DKY5_POPTO|nr:hypothetical protein POTOM_003089 [Populus tomentosa]